MAVANWWWKAVWGFCRGHAMIGWRKSVFNFPEGEHMSVPVGSTAVFIRQASRLLAMCSLVLIRPTRRGPCAIDTIIALFFFSALSLLPSTCKHHILNITIEGEDPVGCFGAIPLSSYWKMNRTRGFNTEQEEDFIANTRRKGFIPGA